MKTIINIADYAPQRRPKLFDVADWSIDKDFIPALEARLQNEIPNIGEVYLDFGDLENVNRSHEVVMESVLQLLLKLDILHRKTYINLPYVFYDYLRRRCNSEVILSARFEKR